MALLTRAEYRKLSGDRDSYDGDVDPALVEIQDAMERYTNRKFDYGTYTEEAIWYGSTFYPAAMPVESVTVPENTTVHKYGVSGYSNYMGIDYARNQDLYGFPAYSEITYMGGFKPGEMPIELQRIAAELARRVLSLTAPRTGAFAELGDLPDNVNSVSVGPISISARGVGRPTTASGSSWPRAWDVFDPGIEKELRRWRRPEV